MPIRTIVVTALIASSVSSLITLNVRFPLMAETVLAGPVPQSQEEPQSSTGCFEIVQPDRYLVYVDLPAWARGETADALIGSVVAELERDYDLHGVETTGWGLLGMFSATISPDRLDALRQDARVRAVSAMPRVQVGSALALPAQLRGEVRQCQTSQPTTDLPAVP